MRYRTVNWELRRQFLLKAHPEGGGSSDPSPHLEFHKVSGSIRESQNFKLKKDL